MDETTNAVDHQKISFGGLRSTTAEAAPADELAFGELGAAGFPFAALEPRPLEGSPPETMPAGAFLGVLPTRAVAVRAGAIDGGGVVAVADACATVVGGSSLATAGVAG